jgi:dTDP-4-amino-4,6-dideoxygalactose transaminase
MNIPFLSFRPTNAQVRSEVLAALERVFDSGWYVLGEEVKQFERAYAAFNGVAHAVGTSNGLDALHIALKAVGIGPGDEVIVPSNTYIATVLAVSYVGALPVFAEPDIRTYNVSADGIRAALTPRTRAVMPVHLYGQCCEMTPIMELAQQHDLKVIEDNAQSQGSTFAGKAAGSWGHINGTSFYPGKNLGALGDAGAVTTDHAHLARAAAILRNYGSEKKYYNEVVGHNMRLDECQAAVLSVKLDRLGEWTRQRQEIAGWYDVALNGLGDLVLPEVHPDATHVYHLYVVRTAQRDALQQHLTERGIGTLIHYPITPHLQDAYRHLGYRAGDFPIAEEIARTCLSLPLWPGMTQDMVAQVAEEISRFFDPRKSDAGRSTLAS